MSKLQADQLRSNVESILKEASTNKRGFTETIELQIGLKNYDPQKDKRFSGSIRLPHATRTKFSVCVLGDQQHCDEAKKLNVDYMSVEDLKKFNKNKKLIKKTWAKYNALLASETIIRMVPRLLGPSLGKAGKFPLVISHNDDMAVKIRQLQCTIKFQLKKVLCIGVAIGSVSLSADDVITNIMMTVNFLISLLKKGWQNVKSLHIKSTMGKVHKIY